MVWQVEAARLWSPSQGDLMCIWASSVMYLLGQDHSCPLKFAAPFVRVYRGKRVFLFFCLHSQLSEQEDFLYPFRQEENGMRRDTPGKA